MHTSAVRLPALPNASEWSKDVVKLLSVQLADNFYFLVHAQGDLANSLGGVFKPVGNWDNSQFRK